MSSRWLVETKHTKFHRNCPSLLAILSWPDHARLREKKHFNDENSLNEKILNYEWHKVVFEEIFEKILWEKNTTRAH